MDAVFWTAYLLGAKVKKETWHTGWKRNPIGIYGGAPVFAHAGRNSFCTENRKYQLAASGEE